MLYDPKDPATSRHQLPFKQWCKSTQSVLGCSGTPRATSFANQCFLEAKVLNPGHLTVSARASSSSATNTSATRKLTKELNQNEFLLY